ncbi:FAD-dependent oxidoreductase [Thalassotalea psychrophila]|uniref:FAD-dependent oxidoreductase n=1 Tax=Thalassotalea psychrophila TaxID=3065647 RepID=A0ABY9TW55_9GAMM|nr:FAD-dependent oxidoreductase [Colwelliaceae bacterium SQ149]
MNKQLPKKARVVIVGGGVIGCSIAYHLTKIGWQDVVLLERKQLTCGTTWHAAGLVGQLRNSLNMTKLAKYTSELYRELEIETGQSTGYKQTGSISIATNSERFEELKRNASMAKVFDMQVDTVTRAEIERMYPLVNTEDVLGGIYIPTDGTANATDTTQALAKGARNGGAQIFQNVKVEKVIRDGDRLTGVETDHGKIDADFVVMCAGMWTREIAATIGVNVPLHACEHYYVVFDNVTGLSREVPVLRDYDSCTYFKEDAGKLLMGAFEPKAKPWGMNGIREDFCFDELPGNFEHFEPLMLSAMHRIPALENAGIQTFFCGPESFTPDVRYHIGQAPNVSNCFVAAGLNSIGLQSAGGIGKVVAEWMKNSKPPADLWEVDIKRNLPFQRNRKYLHDRVSESLGLLYATHWPFRQFETARGVRKSPIYDRLVAKGACHGSAFGWERPNWYAPEGVKAEYEYSYGRQNWFEHSAAEHKAVRENVALFDQMSFAKFRVQGIDAESFLNRICANNVSVKPGRLVYTQWLNEDGGIEADLTVTRIANDDYLVVTSGETETKDFYWLKNHLPEDANCYLTNVTSGMAVISIMGPNARNLLQSMTPNDLSNEAFPFATSQEVELGYAFVRASRITFVGELGWELYIPTEFAQNVYDEIIKAGEPFGLVHAGYHALNSLRIEKGYRHWGHDIMDEDTPIEAGLGFAVKYDKPGGFIGRDALLKQKQSTCTKKLVQFLLEDPEPMLYHNEPIYCNGEIKGYVRSGMYGHTLGGAVALGYIEDPAGVDKEYIDNAKFEIEVAGVRYKAKASLRPMYDPTMAKIKC